MASEAKEKHPPGLYVLFFTEMWERFGFYLLIGILPLYLMDSQKGGLGWTEKQMAVLMGTYLALVYFTPFIGGLLADRLLGCRKTIVIGGIEASLRRIAHYDYWSDQVRRSILLDAKADLLVFGMGERPAWEIARRLADGETVRTMRDIRGTAFAMHHRGEWEPLLEERSRYVTDRRIVVLPSHEEVVADKAAFAAMSRAFQYETNAHNARPLLQTYGDEAVYFNPPAAPLDEAAMDELYDLPFARAPHPDYGAPIPAFETVKHSIVTMRGCFGGCSFCSITEHEGRVIQSRSADSVLREVRALSRMPDYRGVISDIGGPTANMYQMRCKSERIENACRRLSCVHPKICENLVTDHQPLIDLLRRVREEKSVKRAFIASGIRYDLANESPEFIRFVNPGDLRVAREACGACHIAIVEAAERSIMATGAMLFGGGSYNNGILPFKRYILGENYSRDGEATQLLGPVQPDDNMTKKGVLPQLWPLPSWETTPPGATRMPLPSLFTSVLMCLSDSKVGNHTTLPRPPYIRCIHSTASGLMPPTALFSTMPPHTSMPGTAFMVRSFSSYLWTDVTWIACRSETML